MDMTFKGAARRLDDTALPRLGAIIGVGEDEVHAFLDVETRGHGFDAQGRPLILFEPHVFYRNLSGAARTEAIAQGLAYPRWGERPYPSDSYPRLIAACAIDETAALRSASWGLGQVLGENFEAAGFLTVQAMVEGMMDSEEVQLQAAINFIQHNHLDAALRAHDWAAFAKGYNGASYKKNAYDTKLAEAYRKWSRIADTPWPPIAAPAPQPAPPAPVAPVQAPVTPAAPPVAPKGSIHAPAPTNPAPAPRSGKPAAAAGIFAILALSVGTYWHELTAWVSHWF